MGNPDRVRRSPGGGPQGKLIGGVEAMYWAPPKAEEISALGLLPEDFPPPQFDVWPENLPAIQLFSRYCTQWRMGMNGPAGLDYNVILHDLDRRGISGDEHDEMMAAIRIIEEAALKEIHKT